jgi:GrpB-like predicted nucleotidyltransferase (UPF0157 family)
MSVIGPSVPPAWAIEPVDIVDADPGWIARGEQERDHVEILLAPWLAAHVEHIGSTAIPDLPAIPIIDLQAPVGDFADSEPIAVTLAPHNWHYVTPELDQRHWRRFFVKVVDGRRSAHLHLMTLESSSWHERIMFRDALRTNPPLRADYAALKRVLAIEHTDDREPYTSAKSDFIRMVLDHTA